MKQSVTVVLTCLNETPYIREAITQIRTVLASTVYEPQFIVVDDGSSDVSQLRALARSTGSVHVIYHEKNIGRGRCASDGIAASKTDFTACIDPDLEIPAHCLFACFLALEQGADVVIARRYYNFTIKDIIRVILSRGYSTLVQLFLALPYHDTEAGLKAFRTKIIQPVLRQTKDTRWFWDTEIVARSYYAGLAIREVPAVVIKRDDKQTTVHLIKDSLMYFWSLVVFSNDIHKRKI